jgi:hypothetical protein
MCRVELSTEWIGDPDAVLDLIVDHLASRLA